MPQLFGRNSGRWISYMYRIKTISSGSVPAGPPVIFGGSRAWNQMIYLAKWNERHSKSCVFSTLFPNIQATFGKHMFLGVFQKYFLKQWKSLWSHPFPKSCLNLRQLLGNMWFERFSKNKFRKTKITFKLSSILRPFGARSTKLSVWYGYGW